MKGKNILSALIATAMIFLVSCKSTSPAKSMKAAANEFLNALDANQLKKAHADFSHKNRNDWDFFPDKFVKPEKKRFGLTLKEMNAKQKTLAMNLLKTALSEKGLLTTEKVIMLEQVLFDLTKDPIRDKELYYVSIFGKPDVNKTWAWTFEGHHLSINITLVDGHHFSVTPQFYGSNPGVVQKGPHKGLHALADEENVARAIAKSLTPAQMKKANIFKKPPEEIFSFNHTKVDQSLSEFRKGLKYSEMTPAQQNELKKLINIYIEKFRPELLKSLDNSPMTEINSLVFVWVGSLKPMEGHYYRLVTTNHMIEYDNVRNKANHPHMAWREFDGDFGEDLLKKHHHEHH